MQLIRVNNNNNNNDDDDDDDVGPRESSGSTGMGKGHIDHVGAHNLGVQMCPKGGVGEA